MKLNLFGQEVISWMAELIAGRDFSNADFCKFTGLLAHYGGLEYTERIALSHVAEAKDAISVFQPSAARDTLRDLADYAMARKT